MYDEHFCLGASLNGLCRLSAKSTYNYSPLLSYLKFLCGIFMNLLVKQNAWHQKLGGLFSDESNFEESFRGLLKTLSCK